MCLRCAELERRTSNQSARLILGISPTECPHVQPMHKQHTMHVHRMLYAHCLAKVRALYVCAFFLNQVNKLLLTRDVASRIVKKTL